MESLLEKSEVEAYYKSVEKLLYDLCWKASRRYGGNFDELLEAANESFMHACRRFNPSKGTKFSTWIQAWVWPDLITASTKEATYKERFQTGTEEQLTKVVEKKKFSWVEFGEELSEDGQVIVRLIFDPPQSLDNEIRERGNLPRHVRISIREYLRHSLGWSLARVRGSFDDIKKALS